MATRTKKASEENRRNREEVARTITVGTFCKMFDKALFSSIGARTGQNLQACQLNNDADSVIKSQ